MLVYFFLCSSDCPPPHALHTTNEATQLLAKAELSPDVTLSLQHPVSNSTVSTTSRPESPIVREITIEDVAKDPVRVLTLYYDYLESIDSSTEWRDSIIAANHPNKLYLNEQIQEQALMLEDILENIKKVKQLYTDLEGAKKRKARHRTVQRCKKGVGSVFFCGFTGTGLAAYIPPEIALWIVTVGGILVGAYEFGIPAARHFFFPNCQCSDCCKILDEAEIKRDLHGCDIEIRSASKIPALTNNDLCKRIVKRMLHDNDIHLLSTDLLPLTAKYLLYNDRNASLSTSPKSPESA